MVKPKSEPPRENETKQSCFAASSIALQRLGELQGASGVVPRCGGPQQRPRRPTECAASRHGAWPSKPSPPPHRASNTVPAPKWHLPRSGSSHRRWPHAAKRHTLSSCAHVSQRPHRVTGPSRRSNSLTRSPPPSPKHFPPPCAPFRGIEAGGLTRRCTGPGALATRVRVYRPYRSGHLHRPAGRARPVNSKSLGGGEGRTRHFQPSQVHHHCLLRRARCLATWRHHGSAPR